METITIELNFMDPLALHAAGLQVPTTAGIACWPGALPAPGDVLTHADLSFPSGERARFRVVTRSHLFGGARIQRIQLDLELLVLHQP